MGTGSTHRAGNVVGGSCHCLVRFDEGMLVDGAVDAEGSIAVGTCMKGHMGPIGSCRKRRWADLARIDLGLMDRRAEDVARGWGTVWVLGMKGCVVGSTLHRGLAWGRSR